MLCPSGLWFCCSFEGLLAWTMTCGRCEGLTVKQNNKNPFKGRQFTAETILWAVRWYLQFPISYRDLERMFFDRGIQVDHTTLFRWIQAYAPELEKRVRRHLRTTNGSWRGD